MHHAPCIIFFSFCSPRPAGGMRHAPCVVFFVCSPRPAGGMRHAPCVVFFFTAAGKKGAAVPCAMHHASSCVVLFFSPWLARRRGRRCHASCTMCHVVFFTAASEAGGGGTMRRASWFVFFARGWRDAMRPAPPPTETHTSAPRARHASCAHRASRTGRRLAMADGST